jgi:hypothetical protein
VVQLQFSRGESVWRKVGCTTTEDKKHAIFFFSEEIKEAEIHRQLAAKYGQTVV